MIISKQITVTTPEQGRQRTVHYTVFELTAPVLLKNGVTIISLDWQATGTTQLFVGDNGQQWTYEAVMRIGLG